MSVPRESLTADPWLDFHAAQVRAADPHTRIRGVTGLDRLTAIQRFIRYIEEGRRPERFELSRAGRDQPLHRGGCNPRENPLWPLRARDDDQRAIVEETTMAKPKPPPPKGKVPSKTGAKHDANVIKTANSKGKLDGLGKHAKPGGKK